MEFEYHFEPEWINVGNEVSGRTCKVFRICWSDTSLHERFVNLVMDQIRVFAGTCWSEDILSCDCRDDSAHVFMTNDLYCRVLSQLQGFIMRSVRDLHDLEEGLFVQLGLDV